MLSAITQLDLLISDSANTLGFRLQPVILFMAWLW